jgi:hypothetical protein
MKELLTAAGWIAFVVAIVLLVGWYQLTVWEECRAANSIMYCMRVLGR